MLKNSIQSFFHLCHLKPQNISQELMLYVKVRSFSFAKDVINKYKAQKKSSKSKVLRTDLKRTSDQPTVLQ